MPQMLIFPTITSFSAVFVVHSFNHHFYQPCVAVVSAPVTSPGVGLDMELDGVTEDFIFICCFCMIV